MTSPEKSNIITFPGGPGTIGALELRIDLVLMPAPVWRKLLVPARMNFWELHVALQDVMGWDDCHLHQFSVDDPRSGQRLRFGIPDESGFHGVHDILAGWEYPIAPYLSLGGHPALYTYDFGDNWQHEINLEGVADDSEGLVLPKCLEGQGQCPPEDSGGPAMCASLIDRDAEDDFDPDSILFDNPRLRWQRAFGRD